MPRPLCLKCSDLVTPALIGACASVGIERKESTGQVLADYLALQHELKDHECPSPG